MKDWLRFPRVLFIWLYALFTVSAITVVWLGRTLFEREHTQSDQLRRQELEKRAEQEVSAAHSYLAEISELVANSAQQGSAAAVPSGSVVLLAGSAGIRVQPQGRILYVPVQRQANEAQPAVYRDAEVLEFRGQTDLAIERYRVLAQSTQSPIRAGALLRLARVLVAAGKPREALAEYDALSRVTGAWVAGAPADLIARHARLRLLHSAQRKTEAAKLRDDLAAGRWPIDRGQFDFFWTEVAADNGGTDRRLSDAARDGYFLAMRDSASQGQRTIWTSDEPWFLLWRTGAAGRAVFVKPASSPAPAAAGFLLSLRDTDGRRIAGSDLSGRRGAAVRSAAETGLPWTIAVARDSNTSMAPGRPSLLLGLLAVMFAFPAAGTYFIGRAIRKEMETARLQSDFVAAVSHEFRSPLTTIRSLSEMLEAHRIVDQNRQQYYKTLVTESTRLQRLVETLLNFGRLESGKRRLRFEETDASALARDVTSGFVPSGRRIDIRADTQVTLRADREALAVAIRNLIENAIHYSPVCEPIEVIVMQQGRYGLIAIRDHGPGVRREERDAIFDKFVRGSAAASRNVHGTGLGLAMVRQIAEAHRGRIYLDSLIGKGSTFTLAIPIEEKS